MAFLRRSSLIVIPSSSGIFGILFGKGLVLSFNSALLLGNLLRSFVGKNIHQWDLLLAQAKFAYNRSTSQTTGCSPFEAVYGLKPISPLDLAPLPTNTQFSGDADERTKKIKKLHERFELILRSKMRSNASKQINIGSLQLSKKEIWSHSSSKGAFSHNASI
jgi:hypothetical protein